MNFLHFFIFENLLDFLFSLKFFSRFLIILVDFSHFYFFLNFWQRKLLMFFIFLHFSVIFRFFFLDSGKDTSDSFSLSESSFMSGVLGTRPALPDNLPADYKEVVDIFLACTEQDAENRPSANDLLVLIDSILL